MLSPSGRLTTSTGTLDFEFQSTELVSRCVTDRNNSDYIALLYLHWMYLLADSPLCSVKGQKPRRTFRSFYKFLLNTPFKEVCSSFTSLSHKLLKELKLYGTATTTGSFIEEFKDTPIFVEYLYFFNTGDPDVLKYIITFLNFSKKAVIEDPDLESSAFRKWLEVEQGLSILELDDAILSDIKLIIANLLNPLKKSFFFGRFSNGSTKDGMRALSSKIDHFEYNPYIDRSFFKAISHTERVGLTPDVIPDYQKWAQASGEIRNCQRDSELMFVPKSFKTYRSICKERPEIAFFQQAVLHELVEIMNSGPLRKMVFLHDQSHNREGARSGSITGFRDTIDLSSASDSVSFELVRNVFPNYVLRFLVATRSTTVVKKHSNGCDRYSINKFAPMGSAVCFPTQCIVFSAIVLREYLSYTFRDEWRKKISPEFLTNFLDNLTQGIEYSRTRLSSPLVYGDDIICDYRVTDSVISTLSSLGFSVNVEKSFTGSDAVRESCGLYAFCGDDITPLIWKIPHFEGSALPFNTVVALVDLCNRLKDYGYKNTRRALIRYILNIPIVGIKEKYRYNGLNPIPFTSDKARFGIFSENCFNSHLRTRLYDECTDESSTCARYQRDEMLCVSPRTPTKGVDTRDARQRVEYHKWVLSSVKRNDQTLIQGITPYRTIETLVPRLGWTPVDIGG